MRVKVCGITQAKQALQIQEAGADFEGFIFYPPSARYVYKSMSPAQIKKLRSINKVGVFVNADVNTVLRTVDECGLYLVQLHGDESPRYCEKISQYITVVKAFRVQPGDNIAWKIKDYFDDVDMYLFDTEGAGFGGTGKKFDWRMLSGLNINKSFLLSGGIQPGDEENIINFMNDPVAKNLFSVDINSKFESAPGIKSMDKVREFVKNLTNE